MKKLLVLLTSFAFLTVSAQYNLSAPWMAQFNMENRTTPPKFQEIVDAANAYWEYHDKDAKGSGYKPFKRWENYWQNFINEDGYLPTSLDLWNAWIEKETQSNRSVLVDESNWISLGPTDFANRPTSTANIGRINVIIKDPNNPTVYYAGAPAGGIWKSTDAGLTWKPSIDELPQIGVSGIAVDYNDSNIVYIATGDDDAGDSAGIGIWKSTDAGTTWNPTGLNASNSPSSFNDIYIHPSDSNILWVASANGLYKTTDAGTNWVQKQAGNIRDLKINPGDPNIVYAVSSSSFYKSTDGGETFSTITSGLPSTSGRLVIDVTPANPDVVYVVSANTSNGFQGIYKSTDSGTTFVQKQNAVNIFESTQSWYDLAMAVSDTDENEIYVGVLNIWKSSNGGDTFTRLNQWNVHNASYTHADIHFLRFYENELYAGTDGGFFLSSDGGTTFTDLTEGMEISQFYRISVSQQTSNKIAGGTQDNGGFAYFNQWNNYHGGDGMESVIDPNTDNLFYGFMQFGQNLFISSSSGQGSTSAVAGPENGNWITPLAINSESEVYGGYSSLYRLDGSSFTLVSPSFGTDIDALEIDPSEPDIIFVAINASLRKSTDRGVTFDTVENFTTNITSIEVNNNDSNIVYVTTSGTSSGKVFKSVDGGDTFSDITGSLPNVTKNIIKHQGEHPLNPLYIGTNVGVYRLDDTTGIWETYDTNLPNTSVRDLEINLVDNNITAGTYGRGIWRSDLPSPQLAASDVKFIKVDSPDFNSINCGSVSPQIVVKNNGLNDINSIDVSYSVDEGSTTDFTWNGNLVSGASTTINLTNLDLAIGLHEIDIEVSIANDAFPNNNTGSISFYVNDSSYSTVENTFESETDDLLTFNEGGGVPLWKRGVPTGSQLNTASSGTQVYGTNLSGNHPDNTKAFLISKCYDLSVFMDPILKFDMAFAIEPDWDLVYVQYSLDQGSNWSLLGSSSDPNWYNSSRIAGDGIADDCYNCVGGQWTGTETNMTEYSYDLAALSSETTVIFRIVFHSDQSVNDEGCIIDDFYIDGVVADDDGDGVPNVTDNCPNTSNPDQTDTDNDGIGDACDDDDDDDGVTDASDNCPLTANADQADDNNDGIGNVCDVDNDGILNDDDNCPLVANSDQADIDNDGEGDVCDDDIDNDGVLNDNDDCDDTPEGDVVDSSGCTVFTLPSNNFQIQVNSEICRNSNNGSIVVSAVEDLNYTANLTGNGLDLNNVFTSSTTFSDLEAGVYQVCITVDLQPDYEQCFNLTITQPEELIVFSTVNNETESVVLELSGADIYYIEFNGNLITTTEDSIELDLITGINAIKVSTDLDCQGVYERTISNFNEFKIYPNPIENRLTINTYNSDLESISLKLYSILGTVILDKTYYLNNGTVTIDVPEISKGVYLLDIFDGFKSSNFKVIKN